MRLIITISLICVALSACSKLEGPAKSVDDYKAEAIVAAGSTDVVTAMSFFNDNSVIFVDVREAEEIFCSGKNAGAVHVPRGVLEFYIDPASPLHHEVFSAGKKIVFYCATGGRSLLAAGVGVEMGLLDPLFLEGGFKAWAEAGGAIARDTE